MRLAGIINRNRSHSHTRARVPLSAIKSDEQLVVPPFSIFLIFYQNGPTLAFFRLFLVLSNKQYNFYSNSMCKNAMSIQYTAKEFEPMTFQTLVISHYH